MIEGSPTIRFADVWANLVRRWRVIAAVVVVCVAVALALAYLLPKSYTATAVVAVNAIDANANPTSAPPDVNITTEQTLASSRTVVQRAAKALGRDDDPRDLVDQLSVTAPTDADIVQIDATDSDKNAAADLANAVATSYLQVRQDNVAADIRKQTANVSRRISQLQKTGGKAKANTGQNSELSFLQERRSQLLTTSIDPGHVITKALPPRSPSSPGTVIFGAGGLALGLVAGIALALVRERTDPKTRSADRLATVVGHNVVDFGPRSDPDEVANRVILRLGLRLDSPMTRVGVLGVDHASAETLATHLIERLTDAGYNPVYATWTHSSTGASSKQSSSAREPSTPASSAAPSAPASSVPTSAAAQVKAATAAARSDGKARQGSRVVLISATVEDSLSKTASLSRHVDKVVVTAARNGSLRAVEGLLAELKDVGAEVNVVALVDTARVAAV